MAQMSIFSASKNGFHGDSYIFLIRNGVVVLLGCTKLVLPFSFSVDARPSLFCDLIPLLNGPDGLRS